MFHSYLTYVKSEKNSSCPWHGPWMSYGGGAACAPESVLYQTHHLKNNEADTFCSVNYLSEVNKKVHLSTSPQESV